MIDDWFALNDPLSVINGQFRDIIKEDGKLSQPLLVSRIISFNIVKQIDSEPSECP